MPSISQGLLAGGSGFIIVGALTYVPDQLWSPFFCGLPVALVSILFESPERGRSFAPLFVLGALALLAFSLINLSCVQYLDMSPRVAAYLTMGCAALSAPLLYLIARAIDPPG